MALTGGTPPRPAAPGRYLNRASGRMETTRQMKAYRAPANRAPAAARALGAPKGQAPRHQPAGPAHAGPVNPLNMSFPQLHAFNTQQVHENTQNELLPYRQRQTEIGNVETNAQGRYKGYGEATQTLLKGVQEGGEASAKTAQNEAAERTLAASKAIETTGQTTAQGNGGYLDPQVKAQLAAEQGNVQSTGLAGQTGLAAGAASEQRLLESMRGAAAQRTLEGQGALSSLYGKQRGEVQGKEQQVLARMPGQISAADQAGLQKQFTNRATEQGLGIKIGKLGIERQNANTKVFDANAKAQGAKEGHELTARKLQIQAGAQGFNEWAKREDLNIKRMSATDKARYDEAQVRIKDAQRTGKTASPAEGRKYMSELETAASLAHTAGVRKGVTGPALKAAKAKAREAFAKVSKGGTVSNDVIEAAYNLAYYGRLSTSDQAAAISYGLTPQMRAQWFRTK